VNDSKLALIIPAAGSGTRLGGEIPKPYLKIAGKTILEYTLARFQNIEGLDEVIVSTSIRYSDHTKKILSAIYPDIRTAVVEGGEERQHSILNALNAVSENIKFVAVHDAVRPFVTEGVIRSCFQKAKDVGGAIVAVRAKDTIKVSDMDDLIKSTPDRKTLWQAQTPQIFQTNLLKRSYKNAMDQGFLGTDDASLVEFSGSPVVLVEGNEENFKITYPLDFKLAEWIIEKQYE
jgi:2-C-methyl-D-erythritol 4-phosphate cytidylyltransferase